MAAKDEKSESIHITTLQVTISSVDDDFQSKPPTPEATSPLCSAPIKSMQNTSPKPQLKIQRSTRWINATHEIDTIDNYTLIELIKDIKDRYLKKHRSLNNTLALHKHIFKALKCDSGSSVDVYLQTRIKNTIREIYRQQGLQTDDKSSENINELHVYDGKEDEKNSAQCNQSFIQLDTNTMNEIQRVFTSKMAKLLPDKSHLYQLKIQCTDELCTQRLKESKNSNEFLSKCPCIERVCVFLEIYHRFHVELNIANAVNISDHLQSNGYSYYMLLDDFEHIQLSHMGRQDHKMQKLLCQAISDKYPCNSSECYNLIRHNKHRKRRHSARRNRYSKHTNCSLQTDNNYKPSVSVLKLSVSPPETTKFVKCSSKDMAFSQLWDSIHCYFLHSDVRYGCHRDTDSCSHKIIEEQKDIKNDDEDLLSDSDSMPDITPKFTYLGSKEDQKWIRSTQRIDIEQEQKIYARLVQKMGVYRWQGAHGFEYGQPQGLAHIKPKHKNVKEEVLQNIYSPLTIYCWNQTVTKVQQFVQSFAVERMRTDRDGKYFDSALGVQSEWKRGEIPSMKEVTVIKLYTDWDSLQSELKKSFRLESVDDIVERYNLPLPNALNAASALSVSRSSPTRTLKPQLSTLRKGTVSFGSLTHAKTSSIDLYEAIDNLESRLKEFFHWRANLLIFIHKFSEIILPAWNDNEFILYQGVNNKMILNPSSTTSYYGPLSTSSSYYVAQTFATDKGMILALSSQYPRLGLCTAFNASLISDYPEEQEYLIAHIYLRIRRVYTKTFEFIPMDSKLKYCFFVLHLFREQIFTMNSLLETYLIPFIQIHLKDVMQTNEEWLRKEMEGNNIINDNYKYLKDIYEWGRNDFKSNIPKSSVAGIAKKENGTGIIKKSKIFYILIKKFMEFVIEPNLKQILKLDCISPGLRPYFLKNSGQRFVLKKRYNGLQEEVEQIWYEVSFKKLINLFPKTEQIHFSNWYKFDNAALKKLINQIRRQDNKLTAVKFLYYDYNEPLDEHQYFFANNKLDQKLIEKLKKEDWRIWSKQEKSGYFIKLHSD